MNHAMVLATHAASTVTLLIVCAACIAHLNDHMDRSTPLCQRWGFVLTAAGAFGRAVYPWWPTIEYFPFDLVMQTGMALIALSLLRGHLRGWLAHLPGLAILERRHDETRT